MKYRVIRKFKVGDKTYLPGVSADELDKKILKKQIDLGNVAEKVMSKPKKVKVEDGENS